MSFRRHDRGTSYGDELWRVESLYEDQEEVAQAKADIPIMGMGFRVASRKGRTSLDLDRGQNGASWFYSSDALQSAFTTGSPDSISDDTGLRPATRRQRWRR